MTPDHFAGAALFKWVFAQIICLRLCFDSVCVTQCVCVCIWYVLGYPGHRSLVGCGPWVAELDTTAQLIHTYTAIQ